MSAGHLQVVGLIVGLWSLGGVLMYLEGLLPKEPRIVVNMEEF